jgi:hypothetical protein
VARRNFNYKQQPERTSVGPHQLKKLLDLNFDVVKEASNSEEVVILCPQPNCNDRKGKCSVNIKKGLVHCWRCNYSAHAVVFLRQQGIDFEEDALQEIVSLNPLEELEKELTQEEITAQVVPVELPDGFTPVAQAQDSIYVKLIAQMAQRKHLYLEDFIEAGVGFTRAGNWEPFAIFPVLERGLIVYYQGRTYAPRFEGKITKKFPDKKIVPLGAGNWLYGYDQIMRPGVDTVIVVESILNVLSLRWELKFRGITNIEPVAVFKHAISKVQLIKLLASEAQEVCIMYDGDATASAWNEAKKIGGSRKTTVAEMPVGVDANDDVKLALERFQHRQIYTPANELLSVFGG